MAEGEDDKTGGDGKQGNGGRDYTPPASQEEFDQIVERRLARERGKLQERFSDYDDLRKKAERHDALELELSSDKDRAVKEARDEERAKVNAEATPRVVRSEFKAAAKGVLTDDQLAALLEDLDLGKYVTDKGDPDEEKISKKVAAFAPATIVSRSVNLAQGNHQQVTPKPGDAGRLMAERRFGKKQ